MTDESIDYFADWPDLQFAVWLAGFFDGEGTVYMPKNPYGGVCLSISNTNRDVIDSIHRRLGVGDVSESIFVDQPRWKNKYTWRTRRYEDVVRVLVMIQFFCTIKEPAIRRAHARIISWRQRRAPVLAKHDRIIELAAKKLKHEDIARQVGCSRALVSTVLKGFALRKHPGDPLFRNHRSWSEHPNKTTPKVKTRTRRLP